MPTSRAKSTKKSAPRKNTHAFRSRLWSRTKHIAPRFAILWALSSLTFLSFVFKDILLPENITEIFASDLVFAFTLQLLLGAIVALIIYAIRRPASLGAKSVSAVLLSLLFTHYDDRFIKVSDAIWSVLPVIPKPGNDVALASLVFMAILVLLARWVGIFIERRQPGREWLTTFNIVGGLFILVGIIFMGQAPAMLRATHNIAQQGSTEPPEFPNASQAITQDKPDIYYIVLDRYTSGQVLKDQFSYDNSKFLDALRGQGLTVNDNATSNYPYTAMSIASTMTANYNNELTKQFTYESTQTHTLYHNAVRQSPVVKSLKQAGYEYHAIGSWYGTSNYNPLADQDYMRDYTVTIFGKTLQLRDYNKIIFSKSLFYRLSQVSGVPGWPLRLVQKEEVDDLREQLSILESLSTSKEHGGRFIFAHILIPHDPFIFNADGSLSTSPYTDNVGASNKAKYVGQVEFISTQIQQLITNINQQSGGQAVIVLNADEGPYPQVINSSIVKPLAGANGHEEASSNDDMTTWPDSWLQMKYGILQAIQIPRATPEDMAQVSSANVFRVILNRYAGQELPYLPNCQYGLTRGATREFNYIDISSRFGGTNAACKLYESN